MLEKLHKIVKFAAKIEKKSHFSSLISHFFRTFNFVEGTHIRKNPN